MNDQHLSNGSQHARVPSTYYRPLGSENVPPPFKDRTILSGHRPSRSQEEEQQRMRNGARPRAPPSQGVDIFADPPEVGRYRRPRRNSESSVADKSGTLSELDEWRKRERRHRDREARHRGDVQARPQTAKPKKPNQRLDLIDQLDVTSIYGTGCRRTYPTSMCLNFDRWC